MATTIKCSACGGESSIVHENGSARLLKCASCGNEFSVRVHYIEEPIPLETKVYRAHVEIGDPALVRKLQMKTKMVFDGRTNFHLEDLEHHISQGLMSWDLGFYSGQEVDELLPKAEKIGLRVNFVPS